MAPLQRKTHKMTVLSVAILTAGASYLAVELSQIDEVWSRKMEDTFQRQSLLMEMRTQLGYGGCIHNLKNYVLRGDEVYADRFRGAEAKLFEALGQYTGLELSKVESAALADIRKVAVLYRETIDRIRELRKQGAGPVEIDAAVRVDDSPAINGLATIDASLRTTLHYSSESMSEAVTKVMASSFGVFVFLGVVLAFYARMARLIASGIRETSARLRGLAMGRYQLGETVITGGDQEVVELEMAYNELMRGLGNLTEYAETVASCEQGSQREPPVGLVAMDIATRGPLSEAIGAMEHTLRESHGRARREQVKLLHAEKLSKVGLLAAGLAYQVHSPIQGAMGCIKLLSSGRVKAESKQSYLDSCKDALERIDKAARQLLEYARDYTHHAERVDLADAVESAHRLVMAELNRTGIALRVNAPAGEALVWVDRSHMVHAIVNVMLNAIYVTRANQLIHVDLVYEDGFCGVAIRDFGEGIGESELERICEPFYTSKPQGEGTGLGLTVTRDMVGSNGGRLDLQSQAGEGTTITLWLPRESDDVVAGETVESTQAALDE
ncbi:MAG: hypothetical protein CMM74_10645 [Rhodospirillaceae bacterium]|nr:hypothetical protein [Rhodospirillaceae bacterium]